MILGFRDLKFPEINDGMTIVIEDAHLRSQEDNSLSHTYKIDELRKLKEILKYFVFLKK